jgi:beta-xylosidase
VIGIGGRYVLIFTARDHRSGLQCIGRAESATPTGPFVDQSADPFICQTDMGGSIDASVVRDASGQVYVIWKNDGNCCGKPVALWSQRLSADGRSLVGPRAALLYRDQAWEGPLIEGPTMWEEGGKWHLLYSANMWDTDKYATGYGECDSPMGPCRKVGNGPVMQSDAQTAGPGGAEVFTDLRGRRWIAYHGWSPSAVGYNRGGARSLRIDRVDLTGGAVVRGPTSTPQSVP